MIGTPLIGPAGPSGPGRRPHPPPRRTTKAGTDGFAAMAAGLAAGSLFALLLSGCISSRVDRLDSGLEISLVRIDPVSLRTNDNPETISRCSGFLLSEKEVRSFMTHAARFPDDGSDKYRRILPCSASGTAIINGRQYRWVIRTGGVGELVSDADRFVAVCGKGCCDKVPGIC